MDTEDLKKQILKEMRGPGRRVPARLSEELTAAIVALHEQGVPRRQIADRVGVDPNTVSTRLRAAGVPPRQMRKFSPDEVAFIRDYVDRGYSIQAIAEALGRHTSGVANRVRNDGLEYAPHQPFTRAPRIFNGGPVRVDDATVQRIVSAGRRNTTLADVARDAGVTTAVAERVLQQHAPTVWRWQIRGGMAPVGKIVANVAGNWTRHGRSLHDNGLRQPRDFDNLIVDYGADEVARWLQRLEHDHAALRELRRELRNALQRAGARDETGGGA